MTTQLDMIQHRDDLAGHELSPAGMAWIPGGTFRMGPPVVRKVIKGGSYLCAPNYCRRDRPARAARTQLTQQPVTSGSDV